MGNPYPQIVWVWIWVRMLDIQWHREHRFCAIVDSSPPKGGIDALASEQATAVQARLASRRNTSRRTPRLRAAAAGSNNSNHLQFIWKSLIAAPYVLGGYTSLLMRVDQAATTQSAVRKLHFDGGQNHESI